MNNPMWTLQEARILCEQVESALGPLGAHVALGGSCLYRGSSEKDVDLFVYPHKTTEPPDEAHVIHVLSSIGFKFMSERPHEQYGDDKRVLQFEYQEKRVDVFMMFPVAGQVWTLSGVDVAYGETINERGFMRYETTFPPAPPTTRQTNEAMLAAWAAVPRP